MKLTILTVEVESSKSRLIAEDGEATTEEAKAGDIFSVEYSGRNMNFIVDIIHASVLFGDKMVYTLKEYGYSGKLSKVGCDILPLVGKTLTQVTDEDDIKEIRQSSGYC